MADRRGAAGAGGAGGGGDRRAGFKFAGMTTEELRRRREENQVEIRKAKREDSLNKRRNLVEVATPSMGTAPSVGSPISSENSLDVNKKLVSLVLLILFYCRWPRSCPI